MPRRFFDIEERPHTPAPRSYELLMVESLRVSDLGQWALYIVPLATNLTHTPGVLTLAVAPRGRPEDDFRSCCVCEPDYHTQHPMYDHPRTAQ